MQNQLRAIDQDIISKNILNNERQNASLDDKNNSNNITESSEK